MKNSFLKKLAVLMLTLMMVIPAAAFGFAETKPASGPTKAPQNDKVTITAILYRQMNKGENRADENHLIKPEDNLSNIDAGCTSTNSREASRIGEFKYYWENVEFFLTDMETNEKTKVKAQFANDTSARLILGEFPKNKKYLVEINPDSIPMGYHNFFDEGDTLNAQKENPWLVFEKKYVQTKIIIDTSKEGKKNFPIDNKVKFDEMMDFSCYWTVFNVAFAKDEESAKTMYIKDGNGNYQYNPDNTVVRVGRDNTIKAPADPVKDGYKFVGWAVKQAYGPDGKRIQPHGGPKEFPEGTIDREFVYKNFNGNTWGYERLWGFCDTNRINMFKMPMNRTLMLTPKFVRPEVTFDTQGGMPEVKDPMTVGYKKSINNDGLETSKMPKNPVKDGYVFTGWNTAKDGSGQEFTADTIVTENITVYAQYKKAGTGNAGGDKAGKIKTGDNTDLGLISLASILSIAGIAFILRKKSAK